MVAWQLQCNCAALRGCLGVGLDNVSACICCERSSDHLPQQDKLAALDLEAQRAAFHKSTDEYNAAKQKLAGKAQAADAAAAEANALRAAVNEKVSGP